MLNVKAKPAKATKAVAIEAEAATVAPAPTAADKRAIEADARAKAAELFKLLAAQTVSIPVKPATFKPQPLNPKARDLSQRGAAAIALAIAASGQPLADGGTYARTFTLNGISFRIENGCFSDFANSVYSVEASAGLGNETFTLSAGASKRINELLGAHNAKAFLSGSTTRA